MTSANLAPSSSEPGVSLSRLFLKLEYSILQYNFEILAKCTTAYSHMAQQSMDIINYGTSTSPIMQISTTRYAGEYNQETKNWDSKALGYTVR